MTEQRAGAILVLSADTSSLRVVASDPAVLLRVDVTHVGEPGFRYAVDGRPVVGAPEPHDLAGAVKLVGDLVRSHGIAVDAVAHRVGHGGSGRRVAELIDDAGLGRFNGLVDADTLAAARATWPGVAQVACFDNDEATADRHARDLLGYSRRRSPAVASQDRDDRAARMLTDPRDYFARARQRARIDVSRDVAAVMNHRHR